MVSANMHTLMCYGGLHVWFEVIALVPEHPIRTDQWPHIVGTWGSFISYDNTLKRVHYTIEWGKKKHKSGLQICRLDILYKHRMERSRPKTKIPRYQGLLIRNPLTRGNVRTLNTSSISLQLDDCNVYHSYVRRRTKYTIEDATRVHMLQFMI